MEQIATMENKTDSESIRVLIDHNIEGWAVRNDPFLHTILVDRKKNHDRP